MKQPVFLALLGLGFGAAVACRSENQNEPAAPHEESLPLVGIGDGDASVVVVDRQPGDGDGDAEPAVPQLEHCEIDGLPSRGAVEGSWLLDDFDDGNGAILGNGLRGFWYSFGDGSSGHQTPDPFQPEEGGLPGGAFGLHVVGAGFTSWGSIQAVTLATRGEGHDCLFDASAYDGVSFWVKGSVTVEPERFDDIALVDQEVVKVQFHELRTLPLEAGGTCDEFIGPCWNSYRYRAKLTPCWKRHSVRFSELEQDSWGQEFGELDTSQLYQFALEINRYQAFDYWIDGIEFFAGEPPSSEEICEEEPLGGAGGPGVESP